MQSVFIYDSSSSFVHSCGFWPSRFTGKERDAESGLDYFGARYYASTMGRFLSPDWSAKVMPVPYAKLDNPQTLNLYAYVGNNPLSMTDPDGHVWEWLQRLGNWLNGNHWVTNRQLTEQRRAFLLEHVRDDAGANKVKNFTDKQVHDNYKCWQDPGCKQRMLDMGKAAANAAQLIPGGSREEDASGAQDHKLTPGEIENLKQNTGLSAEDIKTEALGTKSVGKYDLYKSGNGEIVAKPKGSSGAGEPTGYTTDDLKSPQN